MVNASEIIEILLAIFLPPVGCARASICSRSSVVLYFTRDAPLMYCMQIIARYRQPVARWHLYSDMHPCLPFTAASATTHLPPTKKCANDDWIRFFFICAESSSHVVAEQIFSSTCVHSLLLTSRCLCMYGCALESKSKSSHIPNIHLHVLLSVLLQYDHVRSSWHLFIHVTDTLPTDVLQQFLRILWVLIFNQYNMYRRNKKCILLVSICTANIVACEIYYKHQLVVRYCEDRNCETADNMTI